MYPRSILNSSVHFVTVLKLAVFELPTALFVGRLRGGSSSVSLFILVLLFEKNEDIVDIFQTNGMQIFPKFTHERTHVGKSEDLRILAAHAVKDVLLTKWKAEAIVLSFDCRPSHNLPGKYVQKNLSKF